MELTLENIRSIFNIGRSFDEDLLSQIELLPMSSGRYAIDNVWLAYLVFYILLMGHTKPLMASNTAMRIWPWLYNNNHMPSLEDLMRDKDDFVVLITFVKDKVRMLEIINVGNGDVTETQNISNSEVDHMLSRVVSIRISKMLRAFMERLPKPKELDPWGEDEADT